MIDDPKKNLGDDDNNTEDKNTLNSDDTSFDNKPSNISPGSQGEESISGTAPDTESIDDEDMLEHAHDMGMQTGEDDEHPQEIDIARDIDKAEEEIRES